MTGRDFRTPPKVTWPKAMFQLKASDFQRGAWANECHTRMCAVGWVATQFGIHPVPNGWSISLNRRVARGWAGDGSGGQKDFPVGSPLHKFARSFAKNLGADSDLFDFCYKNNGLDTLSDLFEFGVSTSSDYGDTDVRLPGGPPTQRQTADAWNKAVEECGYTVDCEIDW